MIVYGSSLSDGNTHSHVNLPVIILGRGGGQRPGRSIGHANQPPMTNLFLTLLDKMGALTEKLCDSTGRVALLSDV